MRVFRVQTPAGAEAKANKALYGIDDNRPVREPLLHAR